MSRDLPDELSEVAVVVYDFNTGEELAEGYANIQFVPHTDRLRVRRNLFEGHFLPATEEGGEALRRRLLTGLSEGAPAMTMQVEYGGETWAFVVKFELDDLTYGFSGRAEPRRV